MSKTPNATRYTQYRHNTYEIILSVFLLSLIVGCSDISQKPDSYVSIDEIVQMSKEGKPMSFILDTIKVSGTVYHLSASQIADLKKQGVSDTVLNYMQQTHLESVRRNQQLLDQKYWTLYNDGYLYGGYPFGWEDGWYPDEPYYPYPINDDTGYQPDD